jgi:GNAT superfamily N-acetyltransferase
MVIVNPDVWGRGVGRQVLQGLPGRASERGWSRTKLWIRASNGALDASTEVKETERRPMRAPLAMVTTSSIWAACPAAMIPLYSEGE